MSLQLDSATTLLGSYQNADAPTIKVLDTTVYPPMLRQGCVSIEFRPPSPAEQAKVRGRLTVLQDDTGLPSGTSAADRARTVWSMLTLVAMNAAAGLEPGSEEAQLVALTELIGLTLPSSGLHTLTFAQPLAAEAIRQAGSFALTCPGAGHLVFTPEAHLSRIMAHALVCPGVPNLPSADLGLEQTSVQLAAAWQDILNRYMETMVPAPANRKMQPEVLLPCGRRTSLDSQAAFLTIVNSDGVPLSYLPPSALLNGAAVCVMFATQQTQAVALAATYGLDAALLRQSLPYSMGVLQLHNKSAMWAQIANPNLNSKHHYWQLLCKLTGTRPPGKPGAKTPNEVPAETRAAVVAVLCAAIQVEGAKAMASPPAAGPDPREAEMLQLAQLNQSAAVGEGAADGDVQLAAPAMGRPVQTRPAVATQSFSAVLAERMRLAGDALDAARQQAAAEAAEQAAAEAAEQAAAEAAERAAAEAAEQAAAEKAAGRQGKRAACQVGPAVVWCECGPPSGGTAMSKAKRAADRAIAAAPPCSQEPPPWTLPESLEPTAADWDRHGPGGGLRCQSTASKNSWGPTAGSCYCKWNHVQAAAGADGALPVSAPCVDCTGCS